MMKNNANAEIDSKKELALTPTEQHGPEVLATAPPSSLSNPITACVTTSSPSKATGKRLSDKTSDCSPNGDNESSRQTDFIACNSSIKTLLSLPYTADRLGNSSSADGEVNVAIHNVNGTLILADGNGCREVDALMTRGVDEKVFNDGDSLQIDISDDADEQSTALATSLKELLLNDSLDRNVQESEILTEEENARQVVRWQLHDMNLVVGSNALICEAPTISSSNGNSKESKEEGSCSDNLMSIKIVDKNEFESQIRSHLELQRRSYAEIVLKQEVIPGSYTPPNLANVVLNPNAVGIETFMKPKSAKPSSKSPVWTCLDAYLDNIIANVPQLALCLQEKGFVQSVRVLDTEGIPHITGGKSLFSPSDVDMNATMILQFLKQNCSKDNCTYLLRREAGETNVRLYDISAISEQKQRKWIWWLAQMSYRFAQKLARYSPMYSSGEARTFRSRQRSLMQNTLDLLEELYDMDDSRGHELMRARVHEDMAATYLTDSVGVNAKFDFYSDFNSDRLSKAQSHFEGAIKLINRLVSTANENDEKGGSVAFEAYLLNLYRLHMKNFDVSLILIEHHIMTRSSSIMQVIRKASLSLANLTKTSEQGLFLWKSPHLHDIRSRHACLWECSGKFARSFAGDKLWRERGHLNGDDVLYVLREVEATLKDLDTASLFGIDSFSMAIDDSLVHLSSLNPLVINRFQFSIDLETQQVISTLDLLNAEKQLPKEKRLSTTAAAVCLNIALATYDKMGLVTEKSSNMNESPRSREIVKSRKTSQTYNLQNLYLVYQRLADACNETGASLLSSSRKLLDEMKGLEQISDKSSRVLNVIILLHAGNSWFQHSLKYFLRCKDRQNIALVRANIAQTYKIFASLRSHSGSEEISVFEINSEVWLQKAADELSIAHDVLEYRDDSNTIFWDKISSDLASTLLILGVRRRQLSFAGTSNSNDLRLSPGVENSIVKPMFQALRIYEELGNRHQAAASNYQLALYFSKVWHVQKSEEKTHDKLSKAFQHFIASYKFFRSSDGDEPTFVVLCVDMSSLYASLPGFEGTLKALTCLIDTSDAFSSERIDSARERNLRGFCDKTWYEKMLTLSAEVQSKILQLLLKLTRSEWNGNQSRKYKEMYRSALIHASKSPSNATGSQFGDSFEIYSLLSLLKKQIGQC